MNFRSIFSGKENSPGDLPVGVVQIDQIFLESMQESMTSLDDQEDCLFALGQEEFVFPSTIVDSFAWGDDLANEVREDKIVDCPDSVDMRDRMEIRHQTAETASEVFSLLPSPFPISNQIWPPQLDAVEEPQLISGPEFQVWEAAGGTNSCRAPTTDNYPHLWERTQVPRDGAKETSLSRNCMTPQPKPIIAVEVAPTIVDVRTASCVAESASSQGPTPSAVPVPRPLSSTPVESTSIISANDSPRTPVVVGKQCSSKTSASRRGRWTKDEHGKFESGIRRFGKSWKKIAMTIPTRTVRQVRTHAQKYLLRLGKEATAKREGRAVPDPTQRAATPSAIVLQLESKTKPLGMIPLEGTETLAEVRAYAMKMFRHELRFACFAFVNRKGIALAVDKEKVTPVLHLIITSRVQHHTFGTLDTLNQLRIRICGFVPPNLGKRKRLAGSSEVTAEKKARAAVLSQFKMRSGMIRCG